jgi:hypothetical protein
VTAPIKWHSSIAKTSARIYAEALIEACEKVGADPRRALTDADEFPKLMKISEVEYSIGWLNGCAESHELTVEAFWDRLLPTLAKQTGAVMTPFRRRLDGRGGK